jgi:hypothetical protein
VPRNRPSKPTRAPSAAREVRDVGEEAVVAADEPAGLVEHGRAVEPARRRHDDVVEPGDALRPHGVRLVEVQVPQACVRRPILLDLLVPDQVRRPEVGVVTEHRVFVCWASSACGLCHPGQEADERVHVVPGERVPHEGHGFAPHHGEEARRVETGQVAAAGAPPPLDEAEVRLAEPHAIVVLVDDRAGVVGVVGRVRVRQPVGPEDVAGLALSLLVGRIEKLL